MTQSNFAVYPVLYSSSKLADCFRVVSANHSAPIWATVYFLAFDISLSRRPSPNAANLGPLIHITESTVAQTVANESKF